MDLTIQLDEETSRAVVDIAWRNRLTLETAVEQAVVNQAFLDELEHQGYRLLLLKKGRLRHLVKVPGGASFRERWRLLGFKAALGY